MTTVLYVHQDGVLSGSAISLASLLRSLDRSRFQPRVLMGREGPAESLFASCGVRVDVLPMDGFWTSPSLPFYHPGYYRNFKALRRPPRLDAYVRDTAPDLIHINDKAMLSAGMAAKRAGVPVVWHLRSAYAGGRSRLLPAVSRAVISRVASHAIAISEDEVEGFNWRIPVDVIYNSVDFGHVDAARARRGVTRAELGLGDDEIAVGMVGLLNETKGAWDFLEAAGSAQAARPDLKLRFVIVAPIPGREPLNWGPRGKLGLIDKTHPEDRAWQLARKAGIDGRLLLTGHVEDVLPVLAGMDIVSVVYRLWAVGRPAFEGMAVGNPVIVNAGHSGQSGVVRHAETGLVVPRGDPRALSEAIISLAGDQALARRLGEAGMAHARRNFDACANARRVEDIYERVLAR